MLDNICHLSFVICHLNKEMDTFKRLLRMPIFILVAMQLKEKYNMRFLESRKRFLYKLIFLALQFAAVTVLMVFAIKICVMFLFNASGAFPVNALVFIFSIIQLLSIIVTCAGLVKSLYFSGDNIVLLSFPVKPDRVFLSKFIVYYLGELRRNYLLFLPLFLAYGIFSGLSFWFYPLLFVMYFLISFLPVMLGGILSVPGMHLAMVFRNYKYLQIALIAAAVTVAGYLVFRVAASIPANFNIIHNFGSYSQKMRNFFNDFARIFFIFKYLTEMMVGPARGIVVTRALVSGSTVATFFVYAGSLVLIGSVTFLFEQKMFFDMATRPNEYKKAHRAQKQRVDKRGELASAVLKEALVTLRTPALFFANYATVFALPLMVFLLNKIFASMSTRMLGDMLCISFNLLIVLLISLCANIPLSFALSSEGRAVYAHKTKPAPPLSSVLSKLFMPAIQTVISLSAAAVIISVVGKFGAANTTCFFVSALLINAGFMLWCVESDIMNPQYDRYYGGTHIGINPNEVKSTLIAFLLSIAAAFVLFYLLNEGSAAAWIKIMGGGAALLAARVYLLRLKLKLYFPQY
ncbi:MAG: hypothetical protein FWE62_02010 [Firmicutes bacterium]|nr:hypothetical protein [Bacillota bacterium]